MAKLPRRKCANKECRQWFHPIRSEQIVCSYECAGAYSKEQTRKAREDAQSSELAKQRAAEKKARAAWRQRKPAIKPSDIPTLKGYTARLVDQKWLRLAARRKSA
nr:recombination protein NinG [Kluyvera ascorbata]